MNNKQSTPKPRQPIKVKLPKKPEFSLPLKSFNFETVKVNLQGQIIKHIQGFAQYHTEELGNGVSLDMVSIPGGEFIMGTDDAEIERLSQKFNWDGFKCEAPQHKVTIKPFFMAKYPITQAQWRTIANRNELKVKRDLKSNPAYFKGKNNPVERVTWDDAVEFCNRLSNLTKKNYQLPSESQWEYACRADTSTPFFFGENITTDLVNYNGNYTYGEEKKGIYRKKTTPLEEFPPNGFGLYDMHGNVWEWCADNWHSNYENVPVDDTPWLDKENNCSMVRGGSWFFNSGSCRSAYRFDRSRDSLSYSIGFRCMF